MTNMIRQHTEFPPIARSPGKPDQQAIHCPTANFGLLSTGSVTNPILITVFDTYNTHIAQFHSQDILTFCLDFLIG